MPATSDASEVLARVRQLMGVPPAVATPASPPAPASPHAHASRAPASPPAPSTAVVPAPRQGGDRLTMHDAVHDLQARMLAVERAVQSSRHEQHGLEAHFMAVLQAERARAERCERALAERTDALQLETVRRAEAEERAQRAALRAEGLESEKAAFEAALAGANAAERARASELDAALLELGALRAERMQREQEQLQEARLTARAARAADEAERRRESLARSIRRVSTSECEVQAGLRFWQLGTSAGTAAAAGSDAADGGRGRSADEAAGAESERAGAPTAQGLPVALAQN